MTVTKSIFWCLFFCVCLFSFCTETVSFLFCGLRCFCFQEHGSYDTFLQRGLSLTLTPQHWLLTECLTLRVLGQNLIAVKKIDRNAARYVNLEVIEGPSYRILWNHHTLKLFSLEGIFIPKQAALQDKVWCLSIILDGARLDL